MEALKGQGVSQEEATELLAEWDANRDGVIRCAVRCSVGCGWRHVWSLLNGAPVHWVLKQSPEHNNH